MRLLNSSTAYVSVQLTNVHSFATVFYPDDHAWRIPHTAEAIQSARTVQCVADDNRRNRGFKVSNKFQRNTF